jgi:predicted O-methyltransferase YrrM
VRKFLQTAKHRLATRLARSHAVAISLRAHGVRYASSIRTHMTWAEQEALWRLAGCVPINGAALEIGSYLGASACFLVAGLPANATLTCVDTWNNETMDDGDRDTFAEFTSNTQPVADQIRTVRSPSNELSTLLANERFDLVFIDGDHSFEAARSDLTWAIAHATDKSFVALHDSVGHAGVGRALGEVLAAGEWRIAGHVDNLLWIRRAD